MDKVLPLSGIRVVELGELIAGPFIGSLLAEFGAEVIKVERPGSGDIMRQFGPLAEGESVFWAVHARNKKSIVLDLKKEAARSVLRDVLAKSDVVINSLRPGTLEGWGLSDVNLRSLYPQLVIVYMSAYGRGGPYSGAGGYDPIAQGYSGLSHATGDADGAPMRAGGAVPVCDFMAGMLGALGAVLSLYARKAQKGVSGQVVDIGLYDAAFRMIGPLLTNYDLTGQIWQRTGNRSLSGAPTGHFRTRDGLWVCTSVHSNQHFEKLAVMLGQQGWLTDERFASLASRTRWRDDIDRCVAEWIAERSRAEVIASFKRLGLTIGPINSVADLAIDEHLGKRGVVSHQHPVLGAIRVPDVVPRLEGTPGSIRDAAPSLGAHTKEILCELLAYSSESVARLVADEVVACAEG
jgi:formyl-CoA transferase